MKEKPVSGEQANTVWYLSFKGHFILIKNEKSKAVMIEPHDTLA